MLKNEKHILLTGKPGTGKTALLEDYRKREEALGKKVLSTAATGIAASNLEDGRTIHSELRWSPSRWEFDYEWCASKIMNADILIVDEISMLGPEMINHISECIKYNENIQLIMSGDFFQLPPVTKNGVPITYAFEAPAWKKLGLKPCLLTDVVRQDNQEFKRMLEKAMLGDPTCIPYFNNNTSKEPIPGAITLCTKNKIADEENEKMIKNLSGREKIYEAEGDTDGVDFGNFKVKKKLTVKLHMRVMAIHNDPAGRYQNGSLGTVVEMKEDSITVIFDNGKKAEIYRMIYEMGNKKDPSKVSIVKQFPLIGGYAITIHKSQGQTFDKINIIAPECWAAGQLYVAWSRARSVEGIYLKNPIKKTDLITDPRVIRFYNNLFYGCAA